jgi:hypothetical protein
MSKINSCRQINVSNYVESDELAIVVKESHVGKIKLNSIK